MTTTDNPLDPRIERLVALVYGELSEAEAAKVRAMIDADPALRAEYEELSGTRTLLRQIDEPAMAPSFVFLDERETEPVSIAPGVGLLGRLFGRGADRRHGRTVGWAPWAVAVAAMLVAVVSLTGVRLERQDGAIALRFGAPSRENPQPSQSTPQDQNLASNPQRGIESESPAQRDDAPLPGGGHLEMTQSPEVRQVSQGAGPYLTKQEFDAYAAGMTQTLLALLNEYSRTRDREVAGLLQAAIDGISEKQSQDYSDLSDRLDALRVGMAQEQLVTKTQLDALLSEGREGSLSPSEDDARKEGQEKEGGK